MSQIKTIKWKSGVDGLDKKSNDATVTRCQPKVAMILCLEDLSNILLMQNVH